MKLCDTCIYGSKTEYFKPCIIYRDDCEYYEEKRGDMTREEAIAYGKRVIDLGLNDETQAFCEIAIKALKQNESAEEWYKLFVEKLEQEPCGDAISRQALQEWIKDKTFGDIVVASEHNFDCLPPVTPEPKTGHCKDCRWWKDSDGVFRRGIGAESQCPMNRIEVYEGNGYCYMFEPQESEDK